MVNKMQKIAAAGELLKLHVFLRSLTRIRTANFAEVLEEDGFDHAPFFRRLGGTNTVSETSADFRAEKPGNRSTRCPAVVPSANDRHKQAQTVVLKAASRKW